MSEKNIPDYAAPINEADLVATEGDDSAAGTPAVTVTVTVPVSMRFCPTSACTSRC